MNHYGILIAAIMPILLFYPGLWVGSKMKTLGGALGSMFGIMILPTYVTVLLLYQVGFPI